MGSISFSTRSLTDCTEIPKSLDADWLGKASRFARLRCRTLKFVFFEHLCLRVRISRTRMPRQSVTGRKLHASDLENKTSEVLGIRRLYGFGRASSGLVQSREPSIRCLAVLVRCKDYLWGGKSCRKLRCLQYRRQSQKSEVNNNGH